jgi:DNA-binding NtrC family response regulator
MFGNVLIVDDDCSVRQSLELYLAHLGLDARSCANGQDALQFITTWIPDLVVTDVRMPGMSGFDLIEALKVTHPGLPVVVITAFDEMEYTIEAIRRGAFDFLEKPIDTGRLRAIIEAVLEQQTLSHDITPIAQGADLGGSGARIVGNAPSVREIFKKIGQVSNSRVSVLLQGESGTGKELVARIIHERGVTASHPFIAVNCSVLAEGLLESELFGHVRGAFTTAVREKKGKCELAGEGTLFLDEIAEISPAFQAKLLRVLHEHEFERVGGETILPLRARVIAATNRNLRERVRQGHFREDLYYRLNVIRIDIPPLRDRLDDLPQLVIHILGKIDKEIHKGVFKVPYEVIEALRRHDWPGNVRELENTLMRAVIASKGDVLEFDALMLRRDTIVVPTSRDADALISLAEIEKRHITRVLSMLQWDKQRACSVLGISRPTLNAKIRAYGLHPIVS